jgi:16S rRNA (adenine1518-N6/adenine1519-N6)-dimethyltransferase
MHIPKKRFGQNFLCDPIVLEKIINIIAPEEKENFIEIGPGLGALTVPLLNKIQKSLIAIELDRDLASDLKKKLSSFDNFTLYQADILKFDFNILKKNQTKYRVIGNLPYNISTPLLFKLFENLDLIGNMHFMLQQEVAQRLSAKPGSKIYGRLSVMAQYYCNIKICLTIPPQAFKPPPKVQSCFVCLKPHTQIPFPAHNYQNFKNLTTQAFNQRRKTIANGLKNFITAKEIQELGIDPKSRPEQLSLEDFVKLSNYISNG